MGCFPTMHVDEDLIIGRKGRVITHSHVHGLCHNLTKPFLVIWLLHGVVMGVEKIRVLVVDDHVLVRKGLKGLIETQKDMECVGQAGDGSEAIDLVLETSPDVVIMDISMPVMNGLVATKEIRTVSPSSRVIILSLHVTASLLRQAVRNGASAYLLKRGVSEELPDVIRTVRRGVPYFSESIPPAFLGEDRFGNRTGS